MPSYAWSDLISANKHTNEYLNSKSAKQVQNYWAEKIARYICGSKNFAYIGKGALTTLICAFHPFTSGHLTMGL
jgi:hypothetical protein